MAHLELPSGDQMTSRMKASSAKTGKSAKSSLHPASNGTGSGIGYSKDDLLEMYRQMYLIRQFEVACGENYARGLIRGFLHLYIGQEATGVGTIAPLNESDYIVTHYRDHGHAIARGLDVNRSMAELFGRKTGLSKGKGGSMHLFDAAKKFMGGHAIVGGQLPLALGLAFSQKYLGTGGVTVCYFGDGSTNQGLYHETLNLAAVWKVPMLFVLENNGYGMGSAVERVRAGSPDFYTDVEKYGIEAAVVDGMDVVAVREATEQAVKKLRAGDGPIFIESKTFRYVGHSYADGQKYRGSQEIDEWRKRDPVEVFPKMLVDRDIASQKEITAIKASVDAEVADAVKFAEESPQPDPDELFDDIYA
jgi:pyruvate dehydrogenase E1 component alpha subunit